MDYFEKVDALRECILLAEYMEHREIRSKFQGVAVRIRDRLSQMEQRGGFLVSRLFANAARTILKIK